MKPPEDRACREVVASTLPEPAATWLGAIFDPVVDTS